MRGQFKPHEQVLPGQYHQVVEAHLLDLGLLVLLVCPDLQAVQGDPRPEVLAVRLPVLVSNVDLPDVVAQSEASVDSVNQSEASIPTLDQ